MTSYTLNHLHCSSGWTFSSWILGVSVRRTHLPNSSFKGDGVRVFLSGRDHPYRQDFHAPTKPLSQTVQSPAPGEKKTHRAYVWAYSSTPFSALKAVVYDFSPSRAGEHARNFLGDWNGKLVCDDFAGYKAGFDHRPVQPGNATHAEPTRLQPLMASANATAVDRPDPEPTCPTRSPTRTEPLLATGCS